MPVANPPSTPAPPLSIPSIQPQDVGNLARTPSPEGRVAVHALLSVSAIAQILTDLGLVTPEDIARMLDKIYHDDVLCADLLSPSETPTRT